MRYDHYYDPFAGEWEMGVKKVRKRSTGRNRNGSPRKMRRTYRWARTGAISNLTFHAAARGMR